MFSFNIQETGTDFLTLLLPLMLCCMMPSMFKGQSSQPQETSESDSWYVNLGIQDAYDNIVKEAEDWRTKAQSGRKKGMFSFLSRKKSMIFVENEVAAPRLYKLKDDAVGDISFELTEVDEGGITIKTTYTSKARSLIQNLRAKMPASIPSAGPKVCPSCGKEMMPEFKMCPFCGAKLK